MNWDYVREQYHKYPPLTQQIYRAVSFAIWARDNNKYPNEASFALSLLKKINQTIKTGDTVD